MDVVAADMVLWKATKYLAFGIGLFVLLSAASYVLSALLSILWSILVVATILLAAAGITYAVTKGVLWFVRNRNRTPATGTNQPSTTASSEDPIDRLNRRYVNGELTEAEFERRLEQELDDSGHDEIDRELNRTQTDRAQSN